MYVQVQLAAKPPTVTLEEPDDCKRFHVAAVGRQDPALLAETLVATSIGRLAGEDAFVRVDAVRTMAEGRVGDDWSRDFDAMLQYADGKGWLDDGGRTIRAHVEWEVPA
jgi:hypothetical protein